MTTTYGFLSVFLDNDSEVPIETNSRVPIWKWVEDLFVLQHCPTSCTSATNAHSVVCILYDIQPLVVPSHRIINVSLYRVTSIWQIVWKLRYELSYWLWNQFLYYPADWSAPFIFDIFVMWKFHSSESHFLGCLLAEKVQALEFDEFGKEWHFEFCWYQFDVHQAKCVFF